MRHWPEVGNLRPVVRVWPFEMIANPRNASPAEPVTLRDTHFWTRRFSYLIALASAVPFFAPAENWPHWRGPNRSGVTAESSGWSNGQPWPSSSRRPAWKTNTGQGASSPVVIETRLFAFGWENGKDTISCLDTASGKQLWRQSYPSPGYGRQARGDQGFYRGATSTPEFDPDTGFLYTLSCDGELSAWNTRDGGSRVWKLNLYDQFDIPRRPQITSRKNTLRDYGYTSSPMVWGDVLIVETGDRKGGNVKGFDKRTGLLIWSSQNRDPAGHSGGFAPMTIDGVRCVAVATSWNALVVRIDGKSAGQTVAEFPWKTDFSNTIAGIAAEGEDLLISSRYNQMAMVRVRITLRSGAKEVWRNRYPTGVCTPVIHRGKIYFANKGIHCVDFETGNLIWEGGKIGDAGSCYVTGDEKLVVWGNGGDLMLVDLADSAKEKRIRILAEMKRVCDDMAWPHVTGAVGRIYCKTVSGELVCFDTANAR